MQQRFRFAVDMQLRGPSADHQLLVSFQSKLFYPHHQIQLLDEGFHDRDGQ